METNIENIKMERYPAYKDSGVEWIGEVPEGWELLKSKYLWKEIIDLSETGDETILSVSQYKGVNTSENDSRSESLIGYKKVKENDLVINIMLAWLGGLGLSNFEGVVSPAYAVYRLTYNNNAKFLHYLYRTNTYLDEFARRSKGVVPSRWRMYTDDFGQVLTLLPSQSEQTRIAQFLDRKTAQIGQAIAQKERLIELLKERRQILIHNAVTRGLNPDVKMKDSGVEWIGMVPEGWEVKRLASFGAFSKGGGISRAELTEAGSPAILYGDIYTKYDISIKDVFHKISSETAKKAVKITKNLLLLTGSGETIEDIGRCVAYLGERVAFAGGDVIIFKQKGNDSLFLSYALNTKGAKSEKARMSKGEIIVHIYGSKLKEIRMPIPPLSEQTRIAAFLDRKTAQIATAIACKQSEIEKLKEYKATLINSAVTGKIKIG